MRVICMKTWTFKYFRPIATSPQKLGIVSEWSTGWKKDGIGGAFVQSVQVKGEVKREVKGKVRLAGNRAAGSRGAGCRAAGRRGGGWRTGMDRR